MGSGTAPASPPTHRVVQVIELLSRRPAEHLSLARIVRETGMSRATAHAVLTQLSADGWTIRDAGGNYGLGLGLLTVARRAEAAFPLRRLAQEPMRELTARLRVPVFLAERDADSILITEVLGTPSVPWIRPGRRLPLAPPVAREFIAWAPESDRAAWLATADPTHRDRLLTVLDAIRTRGYSVERLADDSAPMLEALASLRDSPVTDPLRHRLNALIADLITIDYLPTELGPDNAVVTVAAPIFTTTPTTVTATIVACPDTHLSATELETMGAAVRATADRITQSLGTTA
ncbi:helix-turn-helix domain-containing protein [Nocardia sp. CDC159]|uniref:Helix-turn-helix domain-containing protein n=1 Tax=Nocardia pulmonis TaxID=2951408 RepID=A0A9X2E4B8_9NOCA|nr:MULTISPECIES: helix-turn-helix domain-containing protein [Nocardia]MCM6773390.1 helix-turn-helix domain-containing protein [Nocardia pulmonis]MCM6786277.1 helix-turn-helix domain-containing protein [Nocardia sp. CDC159]